MEIADNAIKYERCEIYLEHVTDSTEAYFINLEDIK